MRPLQLEGLPMSCQSLFTLITRPIMQQRTSSTVLQGIFQNCEHSSVPKFSTEFDHISANNYVTMSKGHSIMSRFSIKNVTVKNGYADRLFVKTRNMFYGMCSSPMLLHSVHRYRNILHVTVMTLNEDSSRSFR